MVCIEMHIFNLAIKIPIMSHNTYTFPTLFLFILFFSISLTAQVKVAADADLVTPAHPSSVLDVMSNTKGMLPPRMTEVQRDAITAPAEGLTLFNTTENCINVHNGSAWETYCELRFSTSCNCVEYLQNYGLATEAWIPIAPPQGFDADWYEQGTTTAPNAITDNIFTQGRVGIGVTTPTQDLHVLGGIQSNARRYYFGEAPTQQRILGSANGATYYVDGGDPTVLQLIFRNSTGDQFGRILGTGSGANFGLRDNANQWVFLSRLGLRTTISSGGNDVIEVLAGGNVGIGTVGPTEVLDVDGGARIRSLPAGVTGDQVVVADGNGVLKKLPASGLGLDDHDWYGQGTTAAPGAITDNIFTQGRVGIGIPAPLQDLHVAGNVRSDGRVYYWGAAQRIAGDNVSALHYYSNHPTISQILIRDGAANQHGRIYGSATGTNFGLRDKDNQWVFQSILNLRTSIASGGTNVLEVLANGNVGIGTAGPTEVLDVNGGARIRTLPAGAAGDQVIVANANGVLRKLPASSLGLDDHDWYGVGTSAAPGAITDNIFTEGNVGIDVLNPAENLHVSGAIRTDQRRVYFGANQQLFGNNADRLDYTSNSASLSKILHFNSNGLFYGGMVGHNDGSFGMNDRDNHWTFRGVHDQFLTMSINNSEKVRILANGNVGIGINAPTNTLDVNGTARVRNLPAGVAADEIVVANANGVLRKLPASSLSSDDHDWYGVGTTAAPGSITDNIFTQGNVGIGIGVPTAALHVQSNQGIIATGNLNAGINMPAGAGTRMVWSSRNAAFRAGRVTGTQWNEASTGLYSVAFGINTIASGSHTFAVGNTTTASGVYSAVTGNLSTASGNVSFATGNNTTASGNYSLAGGNGTTASGISSLAFGTNAQASGNNSISIGESANAGTANSIALGFQTVASGPSTVAIGFQAEATGTGSKAFGGQAISSGFNSTAIGEGIFARSRGEVAVGAFNTDYTPNAPTGFNNNDRIFNVGNGTNNTNRSNVLTIFKGQRTTLTGNLNLTQPANNPTVTTAFVLNNQANTNNAAWVSQSSSINSSTAFQLNNWGTGRGLDLVMFGGGSANPAIDVSHGGTGSGLFLDLQNAANNSIGLRLDHDGTGYGLISNLNNTGNNNIAVMGVNYGPGTGVFGGSSGNRSGVKGTNYQVGGTFYSVLPQGGGKEAGVTGTTDTGIAGVAGSTWRLTAAALNGTQGGYFSSSYGPSGAISLTSLSFANVAYVDAGGTPRKIDGNGAMGTIVKDLKEEPVLMTAMETPEILFSDFGRGQLVNGKAIIKLDPILSKNIVVDENNHMKVFVQLEGDCNGVFVTNKTAEGFEVRELRGGNSNVPFSYMVTANRANEQVDSNILTFDSSKRFAKGPKPIPIKGVGINLSEENRKVDERRKEVKLQYDKGPNQ